MGDQQQAKMPALQVKAGERDVPARARGAGSGNGEALYGYARVSSRDQSLARQLDALGAFGIERRRIYVDKASGKDFERAGYRRLMRCLRPGDTMVIKSIDRLGRNYDEIIEEWRQLTKRRGVAIVVLDMPLLDTRQSHDGVTGEFIADMVLQLLSYVAQVERENIRQRQAEGIAAARARGVRFGRPTIAPPQEFETVRAAYLAHELTGDAAAELCRVSRSTFFRWMSAR